MKVVDIYNQLRRDCSCDTQCESCGNLETDEYAYDDRNFWDNVIPSRKCGKCGKSTKDLGMEPDRITTRYADHEVV